MYRNASSAAAFAATALRSARLATSKARSATITAIALRGSRTAGDGAILAILRDWIVRRKTSAAPRVLRAVGRRLLRAGARWPTVCRAGIRGARRAGTATGSRPDAGVVRRQPDLQQLLGLVRCVERGMCGRAQALGSASGDVAAFRHACPHPSEPSPRLAVRDQLLIRERRQRAGRRRRRHAARISPVAVGRQETRVGSARAPGLRKQRGSRASSRRANPPPATLAIAASRCRSTRGRSGRRGRRRRDSRGAPPPCRRNARCIRGGEPTLDDGEPTRRYGSTMTGVPISTRR